MTTTTTTSEQSGDRIAAKEACPTCGERGRKVKRVTLESLLRPERRADIGDGPHNVCLTPDCGTVYFGAGDAASFVKSDLSVRFGLKETEPPRPLCYCFGHTVEEIEQEVAATGRTTVLEDIKTRLQDGCWCETKNPQGSCCLQTVSKVVEEACANAGRKKEAGMVHPRHQDCCSPVATTEPDGKPVSGERAGLWVAGGSVLSAVIASACCWLPLLLVALGVSVAGVSAAFEKVRPLFLTVSTILLAAGFYFVYVRREAHAKKMWLRRPAGGNQRLNRTMLWIAAAVVLAFAFFPNYAGFVLGKTASRDVQGNASGSRVVTLAIEGMTCEACAITIQKTLAAVPGVGNASVVFADREAHIILDQTSPASKEALIRAIEKAGYVAKLPAQTGTAP